MKSGSESLIEVENVARVVAGPGDLAVLKIKTAAAEAEIFLLGAQLTHWAPAGEAPVIFVSDRSHYAEGTPIRGGVPVCFPWFGPKPGEAQHGFLRNATWDLSEVRVEGEEVVAILTTRATSATRERWPFDFEAQITYRIGRSLRMEFQVTNTSAAGFTFSAALHTYLIVGDIHKVRVTGLEGTDYRDFPDRSVVRRQEDAITFQGETDRVYVNTEATCVLHDPSTGRRIVVAKEGSRSTTVWNPWIAKSAAMGDFGDDEWKRMVCIETANAWENSVELGAGEMHRMSAVISVEKL